MEQSALGLHCLLRYLCCNSYGDYSTYLGTLAASLGEGHCSLEEACLLGASHVVVAILCLVY